MKSKKGASLPQQPTAENQNIITPKDQKFLNKIISFLNSYTGEDKIVTQHLLNELGISRTQLYIKLKAITGLTPALFIRNNRLDRAHQLLLNKNNGLRVNKVMHMVGFSDKKNFVTMFKRRFGVVPSAVGNEKASKPGD